MLSRFSRVLLLVALWTEAHRLLCLWDSPGQNTGVGGYTLLQGIFPTQGANPHLFHLLHWQVVFFVFLFCFVLFFTTSTTWIQMVKRLPTMWEDLGSVPGLGRSPGEGNGNPLQYSCLENPTDGGTW